MERRIMGELVAWKNSSDRMPLLLRGARQVGKTYLLKEFGSRHFGCVHYMNFEDKGLQRIFEGGAFDTESIIFQTEAYFNRPIDRDKDLLILDEIQDAPNAISSLKYFCEKHPELALCCAGSHIGIEGTSSAFPVGKVNLLNLYPMTFDEFLLATNKLLYTALNQGVDTLEVSPAIHDMLWEHQKIYTFVGGMPEIICRYLNHNGDRFEKFMAARNRQQELLHSYEMDFGKYCGPVNAQRIADVFRNIPSQLQRVMDDSVRRYQFSGVIPGQSKYIHLRGPIDWLVHSGLALKVHVTSQPEIPVTACIKENMFKLFLFDIGLMCASMGIEPAAITGQALGTFKGFLAEAFCAQQLIGMKVVDSLVSWRKARSEIEFLIPHKEQVIPLEVKSGSRTQAKSLGVYKNRYQPKLAAKLSANNLRLEEAHVNAPLYMAGYLDRLISRLREF